MNPIILIVILSAIGVLGDVFLKIAGKDHKGVDTKWFILGLVTYAATAFGWFYVIKHIKLSSVGILYALSTAFILVGVGVIYFHDSLNTYEIVGIVLAIVSLFLLNRFL